MKLTVRKNQTKPLVYQIPLLIAVLFAAVMFYLAVISTDRASGHYKWRVVQKNIESISAKKLANLPNFPFSEATPTPTPTPIPTPADFREKFTEFSAKYDPSFLFMFITLLMPGVVFFRSAVGGVSLPKVNPLHDSLRRDVFIMLASFFLSPAFYFLYVWTLRVGLIG